jgi:hypothetical protein
MISWGKVWCLFTQFNELSIAELQLIYRARRRRAVSVSSGLNARDLGFRLLGFLGPSTSWDFWPAFLILLLGLVTDRLLWDASSKGQLLFLTQINRQLLLVSTRLILSLNWNGKRTNKTRYHVYLDGVDMYASAWQKLDGAEAWGRSGDESRSLHSDKKTPRRYRVSTSRKFGPKCWRL